jgi:hypothetical protein
MNESSGKNLEMESCVMFSKLCVSVAPCEKMNGCDHQFVLAR